MQSSSNRPGNSDPGLQERHRVSRFAAVATAAVALLAVGACAGGGSNTEASQTSRPTPSSAEPSPSTASATPVAPPKYPLHTVIGTEFWIGETASDANAGIDNISTEWESDARKTLGGFDDPNKRGDGGLPVFKPKENPFYCAVPLSEFDDNGPIKGVREHSPWAAEAKKLPRNDSRSLFKGRWVEVSRPSNSEKKYCQLLDTGPTNDAEVAHDPVYVWKGDPQKPKNYPGIIKGAGIDLSPSMAVQLFGRSGEDVSGKVQWNFVDAADVPDGPWKQYPAIDNKTHWD